MSVSYGEPMWRPPGRAPRITCLFWCVPDVHHGFPSPWRFWVESGQVFDAWPPRANELTLLRRCLRWLDLPSLGNAARVCRAWRRAIYCSADAWLRAYAACEAALDLPRLCTSPHAHAQREEGGCAVPHCGARAASYRERRGCFHPRSALRAVLRARQRIRAVTGANACESSSRAAGTGAPAEAPMSEAQVRALEAALGAPLPVDVREALKLGQLCPLLTRLLGRRRWRLELRPCEQWAAADGLSLVRSGLGPVRPPQRPVAIGRALAAASATIDVAGAACAGGQAQGTGRVLAAGAVPDSSGAAREAMLLLYDGQVFAAAAPPMPDRPSLSLPAEGGSPLPRLLRNLMPVSTAAACTERARQGDGRDLTLGEGEAAGRLIGNGSGAGGGARALVRGPPPPAMPMSSPQPFCVCYGGLLAC